MRDLNADSALLAGGWDHRYARVVAIAARQGVAGVLVDSNGDGVDVNLDEYRRAPDGTWQEIGSGSVGDEGVGWSPDSVSIWGKAAPGTPVTIRYQGVDEVVLTEPSAWWLFVRPSEPDLDPDAPGALPERIG